MVTPQLLGSFLGSTFHDICLSPGYAPASPGGTPSLLFVSMPRTQPYLGLFLLLGPQISTIASVVEHLSFQSSPFKKHYANQQMSIVTPDFSSCRSSSSSIPLAAICPSIHTCSPKSTNPSIHPTTYLSTHTHTIYTYTHSHTHLSIHSSIHPCVHPFSHLTFYLFNLY